MSKKIERECMQCGKKFLVYPSVIKHGGGKFCSIGCGTTYRNTHNNPAWREEVREKISKNHADVSGEKNPMYGKKGEEAPSYIDGRNSFKGELYRRILLANTKPKDFKCHICDSNENLEVHHKDGKHNNNELDNLMWLCSNCHKNIAHSTLRDNQGRYKAVKTNKII